MTRLEETAWCQASRARSLSLGHPEPRPVGLNQKTGFLLLFVVQKNVLTKCDLSGAIIACRLERYPATNAPQTSKATNSNATDRHEAARISTQRCS